MNSESAVESFDLDDYDEVFDLKVINHIKRSRGLRGRFGVPEGPDEAESRQSIEEVKIFGVDVTDSFDTVTIFDEEGGQMSDHIIEVIKEKFGVV